MAESGLSDYGFAKRKAARQLGADSENGAALPSNAEIEAELRTYLTLYQDKDHAQRLEDMRRIALEVMQLLAEFEPHLHGAVLDGTAGRYDPIKLQLVADSSKDVEIWLLSRNIDYTVEDLAPSRHDDHKHLSRPETRLALDWQGLTVQLEIYASARSRHLANRPGHTVHHQHSADSASLRALLAPAPTV